MRFVKTPEGYVSPRHVVSIHMERHTWLRGYADDSPDEFITHYSFKASLDNGKIVILDTRDDMDEPVDSQAVLDHWLQVFTEAME